MFIYTYYVSCLYSTDKKNSKFFAMYMAGCIRAVGYSVGISTSPMYECLFPILYSTPVGSFYIYDSTKSTRNDASKKLLLSYSLQM